MRQGSTQLVASAIAALIALAALAPAAADTSNETDSVEVPRPPIALRIPVADTLFGDVRVDDYRWLRDRSDPEVRVYLEAENEYTAAMTAHISELTETIYQEMLGRIKETDLSVPYLDNGFYYYERTEEGKQYPTFCRKEGSLDAEEVVLLDENELAREHDYFEIWAKEVSPDNRLLAYSVDSTGSETFTLYIKDLVTGELLPDVITEIDHAVEWANDSSTFFYTTMDETRRSDKLWRHTLGTDPSEDVLVHHETDPGFGVWISRTRSDQYLIMDVGSWDTEEQYLLSADDPFGQFALVHPREDGVEYFLSHRGSEFYIRTNDGAKNYKVMKAPVDAPSKDNWTEVIPHRDGVKIESVDVFANHLVIAERERGQRRVQVMNLDTGDVHYIEFPEPVYAVYPSKNKVYETATIRFMYMSHVTPTSIYDYDMNSRERELLKQREVLGGYDPSLYASERLFATAADGTEVPVSVLYRRDARWDGGNPVYLMGYGAYGTSMDAWFSSNRLSLLDRGVIYATAHVRGGGEMGEEWWEGGSMLSKMNTFTDFIACSEHLITEGYATPDGLVATGGSAGGLVMGAIANMRPDLYRLIIADVPFVDVLNTMLDASIPLTVGEYDEWGNPNDEEYYLYMKSYSPYDNVSALDYPDMLITASLNDPRVQYWEPAKWAARLRATKTGDGVLLLKTNMGAGHGGASGRYERYRERAFEYAFMLDRLGLGSDAVEE
ncbi:S9 family peptidase [bacterium]|nr:S9 family peptidase [bacterium]